MLRYAAQPDHPRLVLAAGVRTPFAKAGGRFAREDVAHLGSVVVRELLARTEVDPGSFDEVVAGCVGQPFDQANPGRVLALRAGIPEEVPARTVARNCASGFEAVTSAAANVLMGLGERYLCVGVEVMSSYPLVFGRRATDWFARLNRAKTPLAKLAALAGFRPSMLAPRVALMEGLTDPVSGLIMGRTAELIAREWGVTREESDRFSLESHRRAQAARDGGRFDLETMPVLPLGARKQDHALRHDDGIRDGQTLEALAKLPPYFEKPDGIVTVGSSSQITDGAVALILTTDRGAAEMGLEPLAAIRGWAWAGLDPARMGLGPVHATAEVLRATGLAMSDFDLIEITEAFAAQVLACQRAYASERYAREKLGLDHAVGELDLERTNVNGGAVALGHPVGATGTRLLLTLAHELRLRDRELGLATLCIGGGQGGAVVLERL